MTAADALDDGIRDVIVSKTCCRDDSSQCGSVAVEVVACYASLSLHFSASRSSEGYCTALRAKTGSGSARIASQVEGPELRGQLGSRAGGRLPITGLHHRPNMQDASRVGARNMTVVQRVATQDRHARHCRGALRGKRTNVRGVSGRHLFLQGGKPQSSDQTKPRGSQGSLYC